MNDDQPQGRRWRPVAVALASLSSLLAANFYLRHTLEDADSRVYSFLEYFYPTQLPRVFGELPLWRLFLPLPELTGSWAATTLLLIYKVERVLTPAGTWEAVNALAIVVAFTTSWLLFRSLVFTITFAICIGFGTQFYHAYAVSGGIASYLFVSYNMLLLLSVTQVVRGERPVWAWRIALAVSLLLNVLAYEGWLDLLVLAWAAAPFLYLILRKWKRHPEARRLLWTVSALTLVGVAYVAIKLSMGFERTEGAEGDVVFSYGTAWLFLDDVIGNAFTHTYLSVSNFLPPAFVGASGLYQVGADRLLSSQHGYHEPFSYLVVMNQVFFWRYFAGAVFVLVVYAFYRSAVRAWRQPSGGAIAPVCFLLMVLLPGTVHTLIKFRPMNAMPAMTYHVTLGVLGVSLMLAWLASGVWRTWTNRPAAIAVVALIWCTVLYGALARPPYLAYMAAQSGLGNLLYPNPMKTLVEKLGGTYTSPSGLPVYQLMPYRRDDRIAAARALLGDLPNALPSLDQWTKTSDQIAASLATGGLDVTGDATQYGYQLMTPPIAVRPGSTYLLRVKIDVQEGRVCAGVLTGDQQRWVVPPDGATAEFQFNAATLDAVRVVIANCYIVDSGNPNSRFRVSGGSYGRLADRESPP